MKQAWIRSYAFPERTLGRFQSAFTFSYCFPAYRVEEWFLELGNPLAIAFPNNLTSSHSVHRSVVIVPQVRRYTSSVYGLVLVSRRAPSQPTQ